MKPSHRTVYLHELQFQQEAELCPNGHKWAWNVNNSSVNIAYSLEKKHVHYFHQ